MYECERACLYVWRVILVCVCVYVCVWWGVNLSFVSQSEKAWFLFLQGDYQELELVYVWG